MKIFKNICELVGNTPLLELSNIEIKENLQATILAKLELSGQEKEQAKKDMGKMLGGASDSILYPANDNYISFSRSYVEELDKKMVDKE